MPDQRRQYVELTDPDDVLELMVTSFETTIGALDAGDWQRANMFFKTVEDCKNALTNYAKNPQKFPLRVQALRITQEKSYHGPGTGANNVSMPDQPGGNGKPNGSSESNK